MYATNILASRVGSSSLSSSCRGVLSRSSPSSSSSSSTTTTTTTTATSTRQQRTRSSSSNNNNNNSAAAAPLLVTSTTAGAACILCHSLRTTAACSASTMAATTTTQQLQRARQLHSSSSITTSSSSSSSSFDAAHPPLPGIGSIATSSHLLLGRANNSTFIPPSTCSLAHAAAAARIHPSSSPLPNQRRLLQPKFRSSSNAAATTLPSSAASDVGLAMSCFSGAAAGQNNVLWQEGITAAASETTPAAAAATTASDSAWTGAILLAAAAATAGGMLLGGPMEGLRGKTTCGGGGAGGIGGHGGGGGGGSGPGGNSGGPIAAGGESSHRHSLDSSMKEKETHAKELDVIHTAIIPRPYEVSVRALRGGRLSMEDEFVVVSGGRLAAVFDGHGGGGVSQYLRDRLHVIISEQLQQQELSQKTKLRGGDIKRFVFGNGLSKKHALSEGDQGLEDGASASSNSPNYNVSHVGKLPITSVVAALKDSFDQVEKEILRHDEYEYQGSTAVATLLHEASDGTRTLISANIGDSRGILSRNGTAIDLTRDHKPNDDKEKARILAMGEKIEWDHYCKVHRVRNLSLSRAIGDRFAKPAVSGEVEIKCFPVYDEKDEFILLASDGLWDVMSSQEVVSYVHKRLNAPPKDGIVITCEKDLANLKSLRRKNLSRFIANEALRRGSGDNISVVIVWLNTT